MANDTHHGGCHCGAVRYTVKLDTAGDAIECNCSMCGRVGSLLMFTTPDNFVLDKGDDNLTDYLFNKHVIHHLFCKTCGIKSFARGKDKTGGDSVAINTRCLDGVELQKLNIVQFDGRSR